MKLSKWANQQGIHYLTAWKWFHDGRIEWAYRTSTGSIFVPDPVTPRSSRVVVYSRVSNRESKASRRTQSDRCVSFANAKGLSVDHIYSEIASGMNDSRWELWKM